MDYDVHLGKKMLKIKSNEYYHRKTFRRCIKIHGPWTLDPSPHTFLHWIKTSVVKIRPALKKWYLFHDLEETKGWYCENNFALQK